MALFHGGEVRGRREGDAGNGFGTEVVLIVAADNNPVRQRATGE
jgi:hypothetical protein